VSHFAPSPVVRQLASSGAAYHPEIATLYEPPFEPVEALSVGDTRASLVGTSDSRCFSLVRLPKTFVPAMPGPMRQCPEAPGATALSATWARFGV
jgi:hypothetical protein